MKTFDSKLTKRKTVRDRSYNRYDDPLYLEAKKQALKDFAEMKNKEPKEKLIKKWKERYYTGGNYHPRLHAKYILMERFKLKTGIVI